MSKKKTPSGQMYASTLAQANKFDSGALPDNRDGNYSSGQRTRLGLALISMLVSSVLAIIFGIAFIILGLFTFPIQAPAAEWLMALLSIVLLVVGVLWIYEGGKQLLRSWWPLLTDMAGGKLAKDQGQVQKDYDDSYYRSMWHRLLDWIIGIFFPSERQFRFNLLSGTHFYRLKDRRFVVSQKAYNALDEGLAHVLYFTPSSQRLINIEPLAE